MQDSESDDFSVSDYEEVGIEISNVDHTILHRTCSKISYKLDVLLATISAPIEILRRPSGIVVSEAICSAVGIRASLPSPNPGAGKEVEGEERKGMKGSNLIGHQEMVSLKSYRNTVQFIQWVLVVKAWEQE
ncbi:hypothetical protein TNCV_1284701 [Trichonephila clavipes]|uniref:Uncharacterized protein n=1 Tax=Trichonephila clavipes TaxID=2585209 RepID=A0A8X6SQZ9_TRICX|nr:hypothetical protein TNCV_1284701 [Trichonephila clavipes]